MNEELLTNAGYRKYKESGVSFPYADFFYQKRFEDSRGTKYFIEFVHYPGMEGLLIKEAWMAVFRNENPSYEFRAHRVDKEITFYEELIENLWKTLGCDYYELNVTN